MKRYLFMIFFTFFMVGILNAGWVIKYKHTSPESGSYTSTLYIDNGKMVQKNKEDVFIFNYKTEKVKVISHKEKAYYDGSIDELLSFASGMKAKMEESMKNLPPEQREMIEQMMGKQMMKNMQPKIRIKNTGKTAKILGWKTTIYEQEVTTPGIMGMGGQTYKTKEYISKDFLKKVILKEINKKDIERISKKLKNAMAQFGILNNYNIVGETEGGVSLKSITYNSDGEKQSEIKIVSLKKGKIPSSLLKPPANYKRKRLKDFYKH